MLHGEAARFGADNLSFRPRVNVFTSRLLKFWRGESSGIKAIGGTSVRQCVLQKMEGAVEEMMGTFYDGRGCRVLVAGCIV